MDSPLTSAAADSVDSFPNQVNAKLRLMCSYGGSIVPRPHDKSLCYVDGDTRIVAVDRRTTAATLSSLTAHLSRNLLNNRPFLLKYQLPEEDLDALISVTTDEDLQNMFDEHDRIKSSPRPSRIRLFLFPSVGSALIDSKAESWLCDALESTKIMQRGQSDESGLVNGLTGLYCRAPSDSSVEAQVESLSNEAKQGLMGSVPESIVLETSSSFGSTSSSISMSNLPPIGVHGDDGGVNLQEKKVKVRSPCSIESDTISPSAFFHPQTAIYQDTVVHIPFAEASSPSAFSNPQTPIYQDPVVHVPLMETKGSPSAVETDSFASDPASGIQMLKTVHLPAHQATLQSDQIQQQQHMSSYIQAGAHYIPQYFGGQFPISSYQPMIYSPLNQQTYSPYQPNQPYPVYLLPVRPPQSYNTSVQYNLLDTATTSMSPSQMHTHATMITPPVAYKEVSAAALPPELATTAYRTVAGATPLVHAPSNQNQPLLVDLSEMAHAPSNQNQPLLVDLSEMHHPSQSVASASIAASNYDNEYEDDLAYTQIYKTQPSAPALLSQYQTMTSAGTVLVSEASKLQHADNSKQHIGNSQAQ